ncbi:MAG: hypothetical protein IKV40_04390 [Clostridia bacterium]|nr:hypothetical protein [Clostridia bacterium]
MKTKLIFAFISLIIVSAMLVSCSPASVPDGESVESTTEAVTEGSTEAPLEAEYSVKAFDKVDPSAVKSLVVRDCNTWEIATVRSTDMISQIVEAVNGISLTYTGMTSEGVYDARVTVHFYNEYGVECSAPITLHNATRCEYKANRKVYYETGRTYSCIYDMENTAGLYGLLLQALGVSD